MEFNYTLCNGNSKIRVCLHNSNNFLQQIWHYELYPKIFISEYFQERGQKVLLKNLSGFLQLRNGCVTLWRFEKTKNNGTYTQKSVFSIEENVKEIQSQDFQHSYAKDVPFIFNN